MFRVYTIWNFHNPHLNPVKKVVNICKIWACFKMPALILGQLQTFKKQEEPKPVNNQEAAICRDTCGVIAWCIRFRHL